MLSYLDSVKLAEHCLVNFFISGIFIGIYILFCSGDEMCCS